MLCSDIIHYSQTIYSYHTQHILRNLVMTYFSISLLSPHKMHLHDPFSMHDIFVLLLAWIRKRDTPSVTPSVTPKLTRTVLVSCNLACQHGSHQSHQASSTEGDRTLRQQQRRIQ